MAITEVKVLLTNYIIVLVAGIALAISVQVSWWYLFPFTVIEAFLVRY
jgi:nucleoside recognition membrane protein YjiH